MSTSLDSDRLKLKRQHLLTELIRYDSFEEFISALPEQELDRLIEYMIMVNDLKKEQMLNYKLKYGLDPDE